MILYQQGKVSAGTVEGEREKFSSNFVLKCMSPILNEKLAMCTAVAAIGILNRRYSEDY